MLYDLFDKIELEMKQGKKLIELKNLLIEYNCNDWISYVKYSPYTYNKELVKKGEYIDMYVICWNINQSSRIHDHPKDGCLLKVLEGALCENIFDSKLEFCYCNILSKSDISYIAGNNMLHSIENRCDDGCVSLHIYSPPNYKTVIY
jgi:cysteine dioxygenase